MSIEYIGGILGLHETSSLYMFLDILVGQIGMVEMCNVAYVQGGRMGRALLWH